MSTKTGRARPLSPDERRTAILDAVIPLLMDKGAAVTTAEMAAAAGIAEGTIFGVFPDKAALLHEAVKTTMDPAPVEEALAAIDPLAPIDDQLIAATRVLTTQFEQATALLGMLRSIPHDAKPHADSHRIASDSMAAVMAALTGLMERHREILSVDPEQAAVILRGLVFTNSHRMLSSSDKIPSERLVAVLLNGITVSGTC